MHPELDFTSPAFRGIIDDSPFRPPPRSMDRPAQPFQRAPAPAPAPPTDDPHSEDCSSCCDDDNCDDKCENDDCTTDGCDDCVDTCAGAVPCPGSPCSPISAPCAQGPCQAVVVCEDEACPVESGAVEILCREGSCQEEDCHTEPCEATCPGLECRETFCPDFSRPVTADRAAAHIPQAPQHMHSGQNCVSYHVNNANSNRWEQQKHHTYYPEAASQFSNISPGNLSLSTAHHLPPFGSLLRTGEYGNAFGDGFPMSLIDMSMPPLQPPPKRRRVSDATPISTPTFDHSYSTTPSSAAQTPITTNYGDVYCLWEDSCEETFFDNVTLHDHIWAAHIGADIDSSNGNGKRCLWDGCGQESSGPIGLLDHVKISHAPLPVKHVCMWADCNAILNSEEGLQKHIDRAHLTSGNQCQWDACDKLAPTEVDLEKHVHSHLATHSDMELDPVAPEGDKTCEWQEDDGHRNIIRCGLDFPTSTELQQHAKDDHIAVLRKKTGYFCHWAGCTRRDKPFSQKGKVERHLQTHTGCK